MARSLTWLRARARWEPTGPPHPHRMAPLVHALAETRPRARFIQIGSSADPRSNPLGEILRRRDWQGVIVEPIPALAERLRLTYADRPGITVEPAAICTEDGERPFYYPVALEEPQASALTSSVDLPEVASVPPRGSLVREVLFLGPNRLTDLDQEIREITVSCLTFESLCRRLRLDRLDFLSIDTEGDEADILKQVDLASTAPVLITYRQDLLGWGVRQKCLDRLAADRYETQKNGAEVWALRPDALTSAEAARLVPVWRSLDEAHSVEGRLAPRRFVGAAIRRVRGRFETNVNEPAPSFPLADHERRYLATGYDDRTPLPPGADYLSRDNPKLLELRRQYTSLDVPAASHHTWAPDRVAENVNLRYFRGDNLYLWHYPEHPRAMALKLFMYMRYLESQGARELLTRLTEDGAFGCWTAEITGYGKISRDLLDSINELLFLDRELGILKRKNLRVLDIGAGYGRLAHRAAAAIRTLTDYCCVDAVPESTFISEYYLRVRACSPPARVVTLEEFIDSEDGPFDLAVNVHSFSECTIAAVSWWVDQLVRLRVPHLFVVPNEAEGILSRERDGSFHPVIPVLEAAGYVTVARERAILDPAVRELAMLSDLFYLFALRS